MAELNDSVLQLRRAVDRLETDGFQGIVEVLYSTASRQYLIRAVEIATRINTLYKIEGTWSDNDGEDDLNKLSAEHWALEKEVEGVVKKFKKMFCNVTMFGRRRELTRTCCAAYMFRRRRELKKMLYKVYGLDRCCRVSYYGIR